jgi:hypothetical protein
LLCLFWRWGPENYLSQLAWNFNPSALSLLSNYNYKCEPPASGSDMILNTT